MSFNENLAKRIRASIKVFSEEFTEKKMFGGLVFLYQGKMTVGIVKDDLVVRVISNKMPELLKMEYVRPMDFNTKPMKEFIYVSANGFTTEFALQSWIELGVEHAKHKLNNNKNNK